MSILPSQIQGSTSTSSSSSASSLNPNSHHGTDPLFSQSTLSPTHSCPSLRISDPHSSLGDSCNVSGLSIQPADDAESSKKVSKLENLNDLKMPAHQNTVTHLQSQSGVEDGGSVLPGSKISSSIISSHDQQSARSANSHANNKRSAGRKAQMTNGNHLLNFQYDPISRPRPRARAPPPRRPHKIKPYNKDLFLQANYKFVVLDTGYHTPEYLDPDKMLRWEDIICVRYSTPSLVQCPICLEHPHCPQITSCGHIYCFPCILRYLLMGKEDQKGDCWKKCPLCFVMLSLKDLFTVHIELLKQYSVGDTIEFMLLTRQKDSFALSFKDKQEDGIRSSDNDEIYDSFSKFIFTSDVDLSVRQAISDLDAWLAKAETGQVDDLEKLPYVCAALEQLEQRKKDWNELQACFKQNDCQIRSQTLLPTGNVSNAGPGACSSRHEASSIDINDDCKFLGNVVQDKLDYSTHVGQTEAVDELLELQQNSNETRDAKDKDSYNFYQATDGQHIILHPLNMKCLLQYYGSYGRLPLRISGKILEFETVTQTEATRRRYRYLSHFSLTTSFQLCEIDLTNLLPSSSMIPFMDEIKKREKQRKQLAKKMQREKIKAESASTCSLSMMAGSGSSYRYDTPNLSLDDFEALGSSPVTSSSPPVGGRQLFSSVTRLGFAAAHDSPSLRIEETDSLHINEVKSDSSGANEIHNATPSFANIISRAKSGGSTESPKANEVGKKGKKPSRVLLSTAGGRRY
ncbi:RING finger protein 10 isoform X1 [Cucurbita pepo subsp. pepo]|uniref:RING finger protein 10 isoform X1 n=1 Tax=Cucurbita pepo subsp. pepo TaxID=3664 RepID=UPI000C9D6C3B|nr:RING finger protein 10 isoform X1 [Cucurbita pepo subsp. pepo]